MSVDFDGLSVEPAQFLPILREAAGGSVPVQDVDAAQNPETWALAFARAVDASAHRGELADAVAALLASTVPAEAQLGLEIQRQTNLLGATALWPLVFDHSARGRAELAALAASALVPLAVKGSATLDTGALALLEDPALAPRLRSALLTLVGALGRDWFFDHLGALQGPNDDDTLGRIGAVAMTLGSGALEAFVATLSARLAEVGTPLPASSLQTLAAMVSVRRNAGT
jgi:hypothetical protein